jgi:hypothetical protein
MITIEYEGFTSDFRVFDAHNHIGLDKEGLVNDSSFKDLENVLGNIDKTVLFPANSPASGPFSILSNMEILEAAKESKGKVIPFYRFDIFEAGGCKYWQTGLCEGMHRCLVKKYFEFDCCSGFDLEVFFRNIKRSGFSGLKLHARASQINYSTLKLDSDVFLEILNNAGKNGLAVTLHTHNKDMLHEFFNIAKKVLPEHEKLVLICAHSGGGSTQQERKESREYAGKQLNKIINSGEGWVPRMLLETSNVFSTYLLNGLLLCNNLKKNRESTKNIRNLVYGTDWPFVKDIMPEQKARNTIRTLFDAGFDQSEISMIMSENLENRLGI